MVAQPLRAHLRRIARLALLAVAVAAVAAGAGWRSAAPAAAGATGLVAAYSFDEGAGSAVGDASGTGNNGSVSNTSWTSAGKYGGALSFNGSSSLVSVPDSPSL